MNRCKSSRAASSGQSIAADLDVLELVEVLVDALVDLGVLVAQTPDVAGQTRGPLENLVVQAVLLLGCDHVLFERGLDFVHLLDHRVGPIVDPPGGRGGQRLLQVDERVVQGLAPLPCLLQRRREIVVLVHRGHRTGGGAE